MSDLRFAVDTLIAERGERFRRWSDGAQESEFMGWGECHDENIAVSDLHDWKTISSQWHLVE